jgi:hypothetical protein
VGHQELLPPSRVSGRCGFGEGTFAGTRGNEEDAPIPAVRRASAERVKSTHSGSSAVPEAMPAHGGNPMKRGLSIFTILRTIPPSLCRSAFVAILVELQRKLLVRLPK